MKAYHGTRVDGVARVFVTIDGGPFVELEHHVLHSPTGLEFGYGGSGPADLARSLLWDFLGAEPTREAYMAFKAAVIARMARAGWVMTGSQVQTWLDGWLSGREGTRFATVREQDSFWQLDPQFGHLHGEVGG